MTSRLAMGAEPRLIAEEILAGAPPHVASLIRLGGGETFGLSLMIGPYAVGQRSVWLRGPAGVVATYSIPECGQLVAEVCLSPVADALGLPLVRFADAQ